MNFLPFFAVIALVPIPFGGLSIIFDDHTGILQVNSRFWNSNKSIDEPSSDFPGLGKMQAEGAESEKVFSGEAVFVRDLLGNLDTVSHPSTEKTAGEGSLAKSDLITVNQIPRPLLFSNSFRPYIRKGTKDEKDEHPNVGAILINGAIHCSGTIVGKRTVLTAAHCIHPHEEAYDSQKATFAVGVDSSNPTLEIVISSYDFPKEPQSGFSYDPDKTWKDDIGLVYLESIVEVIPARIHLGDPSWQLIKEKDLLFVGYGFNFDNWIHFGSGIRRSAYWKAEKIEDRTFSYEEPEGNPCQGDSGGPAFFEEGNSILLVGVTSRGDENCERGTHTRTDVFQAWLETRIL